MSTKKFKSDVSIEALLKLPNLTADRVITLNASGEVEESVVTPTELGSLSGVTSSVQDQLDDKADQVDLDAHINDLAGAHAASAISVTPAGNLAADDVQEALEELQTDVDSRIPSSEKGAVNGVATLDAGGKVPVSQLPNSVMEFKGAYNASTNSPTLADGTGNAGDVYRVSVAGTPTGFTDPSMSEELNVGDFVIYSGTVWQKAPASDAVLSVFGRQGVVTAQSGDYSASQITNTPAGDIVATDVQAAINELDTEKLAIADFGTEFDASLSTKTTDDLTEGATNKYFSDELAQDAVGAMIADTDTINLTYTDGTPELKADVKTQMSITSDASGIKLDGDAASPGNTKYYGTNGSGVKGFYSIPAVGSAGDIQETEANLADNQASAANVTGLAFAAATVRSFKAQVAIERGTNFEVFELLGVQRNADFTMSVESVGDDTGVVFTITTAGQVQYTSSNTGTAPVAKFRALTLTV
jgi:hypothetical protein